MNPASRVYSFIDSVKKMPKDSNTRLLDLYSKLFNVKSVHDLCVIFIKLSSDAYKVRDILTESGRYEKYTKLCETIESITMPTNLDAGYQHVSEKFDYAEPLMMVLSDSFDVPKYAEEDISDQIDGIQQKIDEFMRSVGELDIDKDTKILFATATYRLKMAVDFYKFGGKDAIAEAMAIFKCITKDTPEAKPLIDIVEQALSMAASTATLIGFAVDPNVSQYLLGYLK